MTTLTKPIHRITSAKLDGTFGVDRNRRIVVTLVPGDGREVPDLFELRPLRTRRPERVAVMDVYRWALQNRVRLEQRQKRLSKQ